MFVLYFAYLICKLCQLINNTLPSITASGVLMLGHKAIKEIHCVLHYADVSVCVFCASLEKCMRNVVLVLTNDMLLVMRVS